MVYAALLHSPMEGAKAASVNTDDVMKIKGVTRVIPLPFGVAVVGETVEATRLGRQALKVQWDTSASPAATAAAATILSIPILPSDLRSESAVSSAIARWKSIG